MPGNNMIDTKHDTEPGQLHENFLNHLNDSENIGAMDNPDASAQGTGKCGDSICVYLEILDRRINRIRAFPKGCAYTVACASAICCLAKHKTIEEALQIEPQTVCDELGGLPDDHIHCARLAVNTLGEAIDDYLHKTWKQIH